MMRMILISSKYSVIKESTEITYGLSSVRFLLIAIANKLSFIVWIETEKRRCLAR
jgi:hypothetical protein